MSRSTRLTFAALAVSTATWAGCGRSTTLHVPDASTTVTFTVPVTSPIRLLDLVFMIDNSAMAPKVAKMTAQFPKLIAALQDPNDNNSLPDLRIAIIDSDLGTGGAYTSGSCGPKTLADGTTSPYGDLGRFQMPNARSCGVTSADAMWLEYTKGKPVNFTGDINTVFTCLASGLGPLGCGEEHPLQAFEFALVAGGIGNEGQHAMIRQNALLTLVFITDEDDCSAAMNDGMFGDKTELRGESASLRCATRAHQCGGQNLTMSPPGYPTTTSFSAPLSTCAARTDSCPNTTDGDPDGTDTSVPTRCSPLKNIKHLAQEIKGLKSDPDNQLFVAGIFGWPLSDEDMATATYKIGPVPNPNTADTAHPTVFDLWPVCYDPNHKSASSTDYDPSAAGMGAAPGLRLSAFIDEFGKNGFKASICQSDFSGTMSQIGARLAQQLGSRCLPANYAQYKSCTAHYLIPDGAGGYTRQPEAAPSCDTFPTMPGCFAVFPNGAACAAGEILVQGDLPPGTMLEFSCQ
ncbi:MAG TPA: hypothetical protein VIM14_05875 [Polyangia bacterium]